MDGTRLVVGGNARRQGAHRVRPTRLHDTDIETRRANVLILEIFRLNGRLLAAGDRLVEPVGLTSARWQVLGAIALAAEPLTVADVARQMGLARQSVQRSVDLLAAEGLVDLVDNPRHRRARLLTLTETGQARYAEAMRRYVPWAAVLVAGVDAEALARAGAQLREIRQRIDADESPSSII